MEIHINATPEEIAALVAALQGRREDDQAAAPDGWQDYVLPCSTGDKVGCIQPEPKSICALYRKGNWVTHPDLGDGVVVGFSSITGEPHVFFYSRQRLACVGEDELEAVSVI